MIFLGWVQFKAYRCLAWACRVSKIQYVSIAIRQTVARGAPALAAGCPSVQCNNSGGLFKRDRGDSHRQSEHTLYVQLSH